MDDDPMTFLNAQREKLSALSAMGDVANMQNNLVAQVQQRMRSISDIESGKSQSKLAVDPEVEAWRRKIAELSAGGPPPSRAADLPKPAPKFGKGGSRQVQRPRKSGIQAPRGRGLESMTGDKERERPAGKAIRRRKSELREINGGVDGIAGDTRKREVRKARKDESPHALPLTSEASRGLYSSPHRKESENQRKGRSDSRSRREGARKPPKSPPRSQHPLVKSVEERVEKMPLPSGVDDEVEMWRRKIAALSAVNPTASYQSPIKDSGFSPGSARGSGLDAVKRRAGRNK
mmetsp:Transcript_10000/g.20420  ORF Transcript_10000/g.20420 Transcript_10000/m.20420 type:complete len:291 (+) Transcript_10000:98-970(+)